MDKYTSGRGEPIPSILKKPKSRRKGDLLDKSSKIKKEKVEGGKKKGDAAPLPQGCTPLMYACQQADYKTVVEILNTDPSTVRARDRGLRCALHYCASSGAGVNVASRAACADRVLMAAPALADARDGDGLTPLHLAVVHGNVPLVQTLLAAGADVNARDDEHHTVVHWATVCGEVGALRAVLAGGADAATPDQHGGYPLHYAAQMCGAPAATDHQATLLHKILELLLETRGAALEVLRALIREGNADVSVRDADGRTPLLWAASAGSAAAVLALHQAAAVVDDADGDGLTALHCAAARGHTEALETLVGLCGARVDAADSHGCTPLHYAAALGHADATAALLQHGADSHRQDKRGRSPAHTAAAKGQIETVRMLGARGANLWLRNSKGDLPLHEAVSSGRRELVKWLLDGRPSQVNATNHEGRTPLHVAAATDNADLCRLLLDRGAEVNPVARSSKNEPITPLDCATSRGHRSTAKYLQMHGGLPASKLTNTQIIIDGAPITALPTRKVTSTKIDVKDRIRIEKREIVELSSPLQEIHHFREPVASDTEDSSAAESRSAKRGRKKKESDSHRGRRKRLVNSQRSFSDGYDSELEKQKKKSYDKKKRKNSSRKKSRSRSEPGSKRTNEIFSPKYSDSDSDSLSAAKSYSDKRKSKRHRRQSKRRSSSSSESSSSESSERRSTKRKGKKTSIHIENDEEKQSVNIVNFKGIEKKHIKDQTTELNMVEDTKPVESSPKSRAQSETETDTLSLKTIVTEAQIHVERESSQLGNSEITVTLDSSNNVSIETANMAVAHKDITEEVKSIVENNIILEKSNENKTLDDKNKSDDVETKLESESDSKQIDSKTEQNNKQKEENEIENAEAIETQKPESDSNLDNSKPRKRSFQILSGPEDNDTTTKVENKELPNHPTTPTVSFANKDVIFESKDSDKSCDILMGEQVVHEDSKLESSEDITNSNKKTDSSVGASTSEDKRKDYVSTTASSTELIQSSDKDATNISKGLVTIIDEKSTNDRAVQQVIMETVSEEVPLGQASPQKPRKSSKDSQGSSSRKSSIYETESYKVLSDIASATEAGAGILKKTGKSFLEDDKDSVGGSDKYVKDTLYTRVPSVSDNEIYSHSDVNGRRKRFRKKGKTKSKTTIRSKSENSERGYESSGLMDSGFEPSPRLVQRHRVMSPRLAAYYQQRSASGRNSGKSDSRIPIRKPGDKHAVDMKSVTQKIQTNMRRYYCERRIFQHLLELKRLQIRTSKTNEAVLVKRSIDEYNKSSLATVGLGPYNNPDLSFSTFEKFLYESLRKLQKSGKKHLENLPERPIDFDYGESELYKMSAIPDNPCLCTSKTHRCFHAVHAYTGIPCSAYIPHKWNHHTMPKPSTATSVSKNKGFLPKIDSKPPTGSNKAHVTLEVSHGNERQLIALPAEKLDRNKRYYVTFTVKGSEPASDNDNVSPTETPNIKGVRNG